MPASRNIFASPLMPDPPIPMKCAEAMESGIGSERSGLIMSPPSYFSASASGAERAVDHGDDILGSGACAHVLSRRGHGCDAFPVAQQRDDLLPHDVAGERRIVQEERRAGGHRGCRVQALFAVA